MSVHRRSPETAVHRRPRRLGVKLRPAQRQRPRHRAVRQGAGQPAHAAA